MQRGDLWYAIPLDNYCYEMKAMENKDREQLPLTAEEPDWEEIDRAEAEPEEADPAEGVAAAVYDWGRSLVAAVVGVVLLFTFLVRLVGVSGGSMQDTFYTNDRLVVLNSVFCDFKPGDIVIVDAYNAQLSDTIVKRIIATGGQTVDIDFFTGTVFVDGVALDEPYIKEPTWTAEGIQFPITLGETEVFVMGDNRNKSTDSRSTMLGPVDEQYIQGKAIFLLFPGRTPYTEKPDFSRIGPIK